MPSHSTVSSLTYDDDWKSTKDSDDTSSLYSSTISTIFSENNSSLNLDLHLPPFKLSPDDGYKRPVYEAWTVHVPTEEPLPVRRSIWKSKRPASVWTPNPCVNPCEHDQFELSSLHLKGLDAYQAKHQRCWPARIFRRETKTYEEDLDDRIRSLPGIVQDEIHYLLRDRESATSNRHHRRSWTVVLMREQLHYRFAESEPTESKARKSRFWKDIGSKKRSEPVDYFIVIRGMENKPTTEDEIHTRFGRFDNPWTDMDEKENWERKVASCEKKRKERVTRRNSSRRQPSPPLPATKPRRAHAPPRCPVPPPAPTPPVSYPPPSPVAPYTRPGSMQPSPMMTRPLGPPPTLNPMGFRYSAMPPGSFERPEPLGSIPGSIPGPYCCPSVQPYAGPNTHPGRPGPPPHRPLQVFPMPGTLLPPPSAVTTSWNPSTSPCQACRNSSGCRHTLQWPNNICYRPVRYSERGPTHLPCMICINNPSSPPTSINLSTVPPPPPPPPPLPRPFPGTFMRIPTAAPCIGVPPVVTPPTPTALSPAGNLSTVKTTPATAAQSAPVLSSESEDENAEEIT